MWAERDREHLGLMPIQPTPLPVLLIRLEGVLGRLRRLSECSPYLSCVHSRNDLRKVCWLQHLAKRTHLSVRTDGDHVRNLALGLPAVLESLAPVRIGVGRLWFSELLSDIRFSGYSLFEFLDALLVAPDQSENEASQADDCDDDGLQDWLDTAGACLE